MKEVQYAKDYSNRVSRRKYLFLVVLDWQGLHATAENEKTYLSIKSPGGMARTSLRLILWYAQQKWSER